MLGYLFQHLPDGQIIGAAGFAGAAADTVTCMLGHGIITALGPLAQTVTLQVTVKQETAGDVDAGSTGLDRKSVV